MSIEPPKHARTVLKQRWVVVFPSGASYDAGSSHHLTIADRDAMAQSLAERLNTDLSAEREEPIGEAVEIQVSPALYEQIKASPNGLRFR